MEKIFTLEYQLPVNISQPGDAAIDKGMAGSRKYCGIFELPQRRGRRRSRTVKTILSESFLQPAHTCSLPKERLRLTDSIKGQGKFRCKVGTLRIFLFLTTALCPLHPFLCREPGHRIEISAESPVGIDDHIVSHVHVRLGINDDRLSTGTCFHIEPF